MPIFVKAAGKLIMPLFTSTPGGRAIEKANGLFLTFIKLNIMISEFDILQEYSLGRVYAYLQSIIAIQESESKKIIL